MNLRFCFIVIFLGTLFPTCQKELPLPELGEPIPVVNAIFTPDEKFRVHVSETTSMREEKTKNLIGLSVVIIKNNSIRDTLFSRANGWYESNNFPEEGATYKVIVYYKDQLIWGETKIPTKTEIISNKLIVTNKTVVDEGVTYEIGQLVVKFVNNKLKKNYYEFFMSNKFIDISMPYHYKFVTSPVLINEGLLEYSPRTLVFSDNLFLDDTVFFTYQMASNFDPVDFNQFQQKVNINSISKEYYEFQKSWVIHKFNQQNDNNLDDPLTLLFQGEPYELYSNVTGGLGLVGSYTQDKQLVKLEP